MYLGAYDLNIVSSMRLIETTKAELLKAVAGLYDVMTGEAASSNAMGDSLADIMLSCYLLAPRLGVSLEKLDSKVEKKAKAKMAGGGEAEALFNELSAVVKHLTE